MPELTLMESWVVRELQQIAVRLSKIEAGEPDPGRPPFYLDDMSSVHLMLSRDTQVSLPYCIRRSIFDVRTCTLMSFRAIPPTS